MAISVIDNAKCLTCDSLQITYIYKLNKEHAYDRDCTFVDIK